jgi:hypothetical protein
LELDLFKTVFGSVVLMLSGSHKVEGGFLVVVVVVVSAEIFGHNRSKPWCFHVPPVTCCDLWVVLY